MKNTIKIFYIFLVILILFLSKVIAKEKNLLDDMRVLANELRCMVCQNQTILDSDSSFAEDIRTIILEKLEEGETKDSIKKFLFDRYGDFILFKPRFNYFNLFLWFSPLIFLFFMGLLAFKSISNSNKNIKKINKTNLKNNLK